VIKTLVEKGARLDEPSPAHETALQIARRQGHTPIVNFLRRHGAAHDDARFPVQASSDEDNPAPRS
jgi:ankyrin repeat protein